MAQNYPNPFKDRTTFRIRLTETANISLHIYDLTGKKVATLIDNDTRTAGTFEVSWTPSGISNGMYIASLSSGQQNMQTLKINYNK